MSEDCTSSRTITEVGFSGAEATTLTAIASPFSLAASTEPAVTEAPSAALIPETAASSLYPLELAFTSPLTVTTVFSPAALTAVAMLFPIATAEPTVTLTLFPLPPASTSIVLATMPSAFASFWTVAVPELFVILTAVASYAFAYAESAVTEAPPAALTAVAGLPFPSAVAAVTEPAVTEAPLSASIPLAVPFVDVAVTSFLTVTTVLLFFASTAIALPLLLVAVTESAVTVPPPSLTEIP